MELLINSTHLVRGLNKNYKISELGILPGSDYRASDLAEYKNILSKSVILSAIDWNILVEILIEKIIIIVDNLIFANIKEGDVL